jgi:predicted Zn-dependent protease
MNETDLLSRARCEEIFGLVAEAARAEGVRDVEAMMGAGASALTRFANNTIHQNVAEHGVNLSVRALIDGRTARADSNRLDAESIRGVTSEAIALTRLRTADPDLLPLLEPQSITPRV